jgi:hypothetical protein
MIILNRHFFYLILFAILVNVISSCAQNPPNPPFIAEPSLDGQIVNPADLHMETQPMSDPDPGDTHECSDWEIWAAAPAEMIRLARRVLRQH